MTNLAVSMLRFSAALTLYSVEQLERSLNVVEGGADLSKTIQGFEQTLDSLSEVLMREMDEKKKETLQSVSKASRDMVGRTMEGMEIMDPREVIKASSDLLQKTSDVTAKWVTKAAEAME
jgi:conjugal transfer/entry exclusion protein